MLDGYFYDPNKIVQELELHILARSKRGRYWVL